MLQRTIDGRFVPSEHYTVEQMFAEVAGIEGLTSEQRVRYAWMSCPFVKAFIRNAVSISNIDKMREEYVGHLEDSPAFESFARKARMTANGSEHPIPTGAQKEQSRPPEWYTRYINHSDWRTLRNEAIAYYGSCVLCGICGRDLQCHHRHYRTVCQESIKDVSILCSVHHLATTTMMNLKIPRDPPDSFFAWAEKQRR